MLNAKYVLIVVLGIVCIVALLGLVMGNNVVHYVSDIAYMFPRYAFPR